MLMHSNLTDQINAIVDEETVFAACPECGSQLVARLVDDWQSRSAPIPILGCGNPWHYAVKSLGDAP